MRLNTKRDVLERIGSVRDLRPVGSRPAYMVLDRAAGLYRSGDIASRDLPSRIAQLESLLRKDMPDLVVQRAPRSASVTPRYAGLIVTEPRVLDSPARRRYISAESHAVVLMRSSLQFVSGILPGCTNPHLFEQMVKRGGSVSSLSEVMLGLSNLWPTLLVMRARQRSTGRGVAPSAIVSPYGNGLLFASLEKVEDMPCGGTIAVTVRRGGGFHERELRDWYAQGSQRVSVETKTFVHGDKLKPHQAEIRDRLVAFERKYRDVVAHGDWRWRIGIGQADEAVNAVATAFRLVSPTFEQTEEALDELERIVESASWIAEVNVNSDNQCRSKA